MKSVAGHYYDFDREPRLDGIADQTDTLRIQEKSKRSEDISLAFRYPAQLKIEGEKATDETLFYGGGGGDACRRMCAVNAGCSCQHMPINVDC
ncbi:MAG: hypothetical protein MJ033_00325 [Victivallaceae bacterium]|nr:hypothetical protein [Victivallaceae bacterium]